MVGSECGTILELVESDKSCIFARSKSGEIRVAAPKNPSIA
jgi:hypothetical protein